MRTTLGVLGATLLMAAAPTVMAQQVATYDPQQLPATEGQVAQFSLTPRGDVDGVILQVGTQVHMLPHLGGQLVQAVKPGDTVTVRGLKAQALPLIQGFSISDQASGQTVTDNGPPPRPPQPAAANSQWLQVQGRVKETLYGPRGDMNGALLDDGTQIYLPPNQAAAMRQDLQPGGILVAEGYGVSGTYGTSIDAQHIGASQAQLVQVGPPAPPCHRPPPPPPGAGPEAAPPPAPR